MAEARGPAPTVVIRGGTVVDATGWRRADVVVADGVVVSLDDAVTPPRGSTVLDAGGCLVAPGLVDLHTHLREPGDEQAETIESGTRAAALGGYTAVVAMPNTDPPLDSAPAVRAVLDRAASALVQVAVAGAITVGRAGERLSPMAEMAALGVRMFTDDGSGVQSAAVMRRAMEYGRGLGVTLAQHCEDADLVGDGVMHEGAWSSRLGLAGRPAAAEEVMVARDLVLAGLTGARLHLLHLSTAGSVALVAAAKSRGAAVTAEAAPHHFTLTDSEVATFDPVFKVHPPLRGRSDVDAVVRGLADGTIDAIATDHAPHRADRKELPFDEAPAGMVGLETALALALTELDAGWAAGWPTGNGNGARSGKNDETGQTPEDRERDLVSRILALMSWQPAVIAGLDPGHGGVQGGPIAPGAPANLCVVDPGARWTVDRAFLASRSKNTPFAGRTLRGRVRHTIVRGEPVVRDGEATR